MKPFTAMAAPFKAAALALALFAAPSFAVAGPQFIDKSGYAVSGFDVVAYRSLEQAPVGQAQPKATPGNSAFTTEWNGAKWAFASAENRDKFLANPEYYAPQYDGHCAYGVAQGGKVPANPHLWRIVDGKLYLNIKDTVVGFWEEDIPGNIATADTNWGGIEEQASVVRNAPDFDESFAPVN